MNEREPEGWKVQFGWLELALLDMENIWLDFGVWHWFST